MIGEEWRVDLGVSTGNPTVSGKRLSDQPRFLYPKTTFLIPISCGWYESCYKLILNYRSGKAPRFIQHPGLRSATLLLSSNLRLRCVGADGV